MPKIMRMVTRGAMAGAACGVLVAAIYNSYSPEDPSSPDLDVMFLVAAPLGAVLLLLGRLPRWWLVALIGPIAASALSVNLFVALTMALAWVPIPASTWIPISDEMYMGVVFALACAIGYGATTWAVSTAAGRMTRIVIAAGLAVVIVLEFMPGSPWWS
ncbi:hypothetical protein HCN51_09035 [Nonomuraea sp. FMUSA5-5]|uniref:Uncharacterized protein n=1 Tax=Nonomuraea composti TaxID=2720023 RepID=A0ABX1B304_9ACTN|nr:hypothetical protein [Nonomuraea sp. FMUSA5-5]NJP89586.1 hypothetical protein [Nonomuraea sp. FMUSA5-5]